MSITEMGEVREYISSLKAGEEVSVNGKSCLVWEVTSDELRMVKAVSSSATSGSVRLQKMVLNVNAREGISVKDDGSLVARLPLGDKGSVAPLPTDVDDKTDYGPNADWASVNHQTAMRALADGGYI